MTKKVYKQKYFSVIIKNSNWKILKDRMVLRMKNFNILGFYWKILTFRGGLKKNQYRGVGLPKKEGLDS